MVRIPRARVKRRAQNLHRVWRRPVHIETSEDERKHLLSFDGTEHKSTRL